MFEEFGWRALQQAGKLMAEVQDPLAELRDIHLPAPPDLWPPAPGWWILGVLVIALCVYGAYLGYKLWRRNAYRRHGLKELDDSAEPGLPTTELLADLNDLLKRVALGCSPRDDVAQLPENPGWPIWIQKFPVTSSPWAPVRY